MSGLYLPVLYGSVRIGRVSFSVAEFVAGELAKRPGVETRLFDPKDLPFGNLELREWEMPTPDPKVTEFVEEMGRADGFVLVTPEYNHGPPGTLKNLLDHLFDEWNRKPFALVTAGGISGGLRAADGLRLILPGIRAICVPAMVPVHQVGTEFGPSGPVEPDKWRKRLAPMFEELEWYARALQPARAAAAPPKMP
ncbi:MAG TPA: NAD(P)H-dependent oxidoreductase [Thermoplasmata archaeon]|nr:NAD(P)H-dependent oxidoreductase [Thermoplasmata archaeon]